MNVDGNIHWEELGNNKMKWVVWKLILLGKEKKPVNKQIKVQREKNKLSWKCLRKIDRSERLMEI